jgi:catechol 2,3-dioxygenase-like lactoylglutathione lyase family enzyme
MDQVLSLDHVQVAIPAGGEDAARDFWVGLLGFVEETKPPALAVRGGAWFRSASGVVVHVGVDPVFVAATKAHPAFVVRDLDALVVALEAAGHPVRWDEELPDVRRLHANDPFGNRIELIQA